MRPGFETAGKTASGQPLPISVSEDDAGSYTSSLCVRAHSNGHVRWGPSIRVERRYVLVEGTFSMLPLYMMRSSTISTSQSPHASSGDGPLGSRVKASATGCLSGSSVSATMSTYPGLPYRAFFGRVCYPAGALGDWGAAEFWFDPF